VKEEGKWRISGFDEIFSGLLRTGADPLASETSSEYTKTEYIYLYIFFFY
jgi:hypothetical protein